MCDFRKLIWFFPKSIIGQKVKDSQARKSLLDEICYINITRLKNLIHIVVIFVLVLLFFDVFSNEIWDKKIQHHYLILDSFMFAYLTSTIIYFRKQSPFITGKINKTTLFLFRLTLVITFLWTALVSVNEIESSDGFPTFLIGCFVMATIFLLSKLFMLLLLSIGITTLILGTYIFGSGINDSFAGYFPSFFLIVISYVTSRILYANFIKAYAANYELNRTNEHLDDLVKMRTMELSEINTKLEQEINISHRYEDKLRLEKQKAEEADRLKSAFLANMSHEIRTPLNGIVGFSDLLGRKDLPNDKRNRYISVIKSNSNQLIQIINDIIDISMIESNQLKYKYEEIKVKQIFERSINLYNGLGIKKEKNVEFYSELIDIEDNLSIWSDMNRISQVIYNLIGNAFKFTDEGYVKFSMRKNGNNLFVCVEDTGIGISQEKATIIFERFRQIEDTSSRKFSGTGLGLSISKAIVQHLNGDIWLDKYYKDGARFCFSIPIVLTKNAQTGKEILNIKSSIAKDKQV